LPRWIEEQAIFTQPHFSRSLGAGERAAIALTIQLPADFVVLDDWDARSSAIELGLRVIGSLGLLVRAKGRGQIGEVRPLMDAMISHGLYASEKLYRQILSIAGEDK
jgi:predicted nucleic acid-binding protein